MADESSLTSDVARAAHAKALLEDALLKEAFDKLRDGYLAAWEATAPTDSLAREKLFLAIRTLPAVRKNLETLMMDGRVAEKQLANIAEDKRRGRPPKNL